MPPELEVELDIASGEIVTPPVELLDADRDAPADRTGELDDDSDDEADGRVVEDDEADGDTDDEREAVRARRREARKHRKQAIRDREETLRRELAARDTIINEMRGRLDAIDRRSSGSELAQIEQAKSQTAQNYAYYKDQIRIATEAGNGTLVADATENMLQLQKRFDELQNYERAHKQRQATPAPLDARLANHAKEWMSKNKWYDPNAKDQDSRIVMTLDQQLAQEGWNPTTKEYWDELSVRVNRYIPGKAQAGGRRTAPNTEANAPRSPVAGSGKETRGPSSAGSYKLSSERVAALKEAGVWDDPKKRADAVKRFRDFDKENKE